MGAARRQEWNAASEALRELDEEDESMEDELEDTGMDVDTAPGAAARAKEELEAQQSKDGGKKRSRTLTTPQQTKVLNALLAKVRLVWTLSLGLAWS